MPLYPIFQIEFKVALDSLSNELFISNIPRISRKYFLLMRGMLSRILRDGPTKHLNIR